MGVEFRDGFHNGDRVAADRAFGGVLFQDGGQLIERAAGVAPAPQVDEAFVVELVVNGVAVGLDQGCPRFEQVQGAPRDFCWAAV